jgi:hypothetical protein
VDWDGCCVSCWISSCVCVVHGRRDVLEYATVNVTLRECMSLVLRNDKTILSGEGSICESLRGTAPRQSARCRGYIG